MQRSKTKNQIKLTNRKKPNKKQMYKTKKVKSPNKKCTTTKNTRETINKHINNQAKHKRKQNEST